MRHGWRFLFKEGLGWLCGLMDVMGLSTWWVYGL